MKTSTRVDLVLVLCTLNLGLGVWVAVTTQQLTTATEQLNRSTEQWAAVTLKPTPPPTSCASDPSISPTTERCEYQYNFVRITRNDPPTKGTFSGMEIDAIGVTIGGVEYFATAVEDHRQSQPHRHNNLDITQVLGPPDSGCKPMNFYAMGRAGDDLVVSFGRPFGPGDSVTVYELGPTLCPKGQSPSDTISSWTDESYDVSVSSDTSPSNFVSIGQGGAGLNVLSIP